MKLSINEAILSLEDATRLAGISPQIDHAMRTRALLRTETEMRISVLDAVHYPTPAARYWQSTREQCVQVEQLTRAGFDSRRNDIKRRRAHEAMAEAKAFGDSIGVDEHQIVIDECNLSDKMLSLEAADRVREILLWEKLKSEDVAADPTFDRDDVDAHQLVSYTKRFILRAQHSDASKMSGGELDNLLGQLRAGVRRAMQINVLPQVLNGLPKPAVDLVEKQIKHHALLTQRKAP